MAQNEILLMNLFSFEMVWSPTGGLGVETGEKDGNENSVVGILKVVGSDWSGDMEKGQSKNWSEGKFKITGEGIRGEPLRVGIGNQ